MVDKLLELYEVMLKEAEEKGDEEEIEEKEEEECDESDDGDEDDEEKMDEGEVDMKTVLKVQKILKGAAKGTLTSIAGWINKETDKI